MWHIIDAQEKVIYTIVIVSSINEKKFSGQNREDI